MVGFATVTVKSNGNNGTLDRYVCAFRGRRDAYQAPLALAEASLLDTFITDAYAYPGMQRLAAVAPGSLRERVLFRHEPGIPNERVQCLWGTTLLEHARHRLGREATVTFAKLDANFSYAAANRARTHRSNLFLYSPYAFEAFVARYSHTPHKVLFQFHPHPEMEARILSDDQRRFPFVRESFIAESGALLNGRLRTRTNDAWRYADLILCASDFTKHSLLELGAAEKICRVLPYGVEVQSNQEASKPPEQFKVLFVGAGSQRKGLHHLLLAWRQASLPSGSYLTLVCRNIDGGIEKLAREIPNVELLRGLTGHELKRRFESSALFAMPSLVEGFGQVYLEALAAGCPVLGTPNSCLPDLGDVQDGIFTIEPGNVEELTATLEALAVTLPGNAELRQHAKECARRLPWSEFRRNLIATLREAAAH